MESREVGLTQLRDVEKKLLAINYQPVSRKQKLLYVRDLAYLSHTRLLVGDIPMSKKLLEEAEKVLATISGVSSFKRDSSKSVENQLKQKNELDLKAIEALKEIRLLNSFILEQRAYQAFLQDDLDTASRQYKKIIAGKSGSDVQLSLLLDRVSQMRACIALGQNKPDMAMRLRGDIIKNLDDLLEDHPGAKRFKMMHRRITDQSFSIQQQLDCQDVRFIVFPLRKVKNDQN